MKRVLAFLMATACTVAAACQPNSSKAGTIVLPSHDVHVPAAVRDRLLGVADVEAFIVMPNQDCVVVYDTQRDTPDNVFREDNRPRIAFFRSGDVALNLDSVSLAPVRPVFFNGMAVLLVSHHTSITAFAFRLAEDGSGTFFVFVGQKPDGYKVIATLDRTQAQLRFRDDSSGRFELWAADGEFYRDPDKQCVWCPKFYKKTTYAWRNGELRLLRTSRSKRGYLPEPFSEASFILMK